MNSMLLKRTGTLLLGSCIALLSICLLVTLPSLIFFGEFNEEFNFLEMKMGFSLQNFLNSLWHTILGVLTFYDANLVLPSGETAFFPYIKSNYVYSLTILFAAIALSVILAFAVTFLFVTLPEKIKKAFLNILTITEAVPDICIIFLFQYGIIFLYKSTGFKLLQIYGFNSNVYFLPIVCLALVPFFLLTRLLVTIVNEEYEKNYVELAKAKGLSYMGVFFKHVIRNVFYSFAQHFGLVYWYMLSGLFIVEYLFELKGFTYILYDSLQPEIMAIGILMIMLPYILVLALIRLVNYVVIGREEANEA